MKRILLLGSTGSIGRQTLEVVAQCAGRFSVAGLSAHRNGALAAEQALRFGARNLVLTGPQGLENARRRLRGKGVRLLEGPEGLLRILREGDYELVVQAVTGAAGLPFSVEVLRLGKDLALANKESMVVAGACLRRMATESGSRILPIDSEHAAVFQCLEGRRIEEVRRVYLTGSGGPFRTRPLRELESVTPAEALRHPNWSMGPRITVDSATMMNKAFEVIEAHYLFGLAAEQVQVLIHPQSIIHSMVEFTDGTILAQMGVPDMRVPIHRALSFPERGSFPLEPFDPVRFRQLHLEPPDPSRYPALRLGYEAVQAGGTAGAVLNAADEVAVQMFLDGQVPFPEISRMAAAVLDRHPRVCDPGLDQILEADRWAREEAKRLLPVTP